MTKKYNAQQYLERLRELEAALDDLEAQSYRWRSARGDLELLYYLETIVDDEQGSWVNADKARQDVDALFCALYDKGLEFPSRDEDYGYDLEAVTELVEEVRRDRP